MDKLGPNRPASGLGGHVEVDRRSFTIYGSPEATCSCFVDVLPSCRIDDWRAKAILGPKGARVLLSPNLRAPILHNAHTPQSRVRGIP